MEKTTLRMDLRTLKPLIYSNIARPRSLVIKKMGALGCVKLYGLSTPKERTDYFKKAGFSFKCGTPFHGPFNNGTPSRPCDWSQERKFAQCYAPNPGDCPYSAATCLKHKNNASPELHAWLQN